MRLNDSEWAVMQALWERSPASAREVLERVHAQTGWAYTTVRTVLARLAEKGAVLEKKRANTSLYEPLVSRELARRTALRALLDKAFDGTFGDLVLHMIASEKLGKREREKLARLLATRPDKDRPQ